MVKEKMVGQEDKIGREPSEGHSQYVPLSSLNWEEIKFFCYPLIRRIIFLFTLKASRNSPRISLLSISLSFSQLVVYTAFILLKALSELSHQRKDSVFHQNKILLLFGCEFCG